jgi:CheY-like chemotaxis protein
LTAATTDANNSGIGRIEVLRNTDNIIHTYLQALHNAKTKWDYCTDVKALSVAFAIEPIKRALLDAKETRGIMIRFVTEITRDNIPYCKEIMKIGKVRHLDGVKGNFGISDTEYIATATPIGSEPIITHAIYSNVEEDLQQQHYIFEILWKNAIPAEQKIREIEAMIRLTAMVQQSNLHYLKKESKEESNMHMRILLIDDNRDIADMVRLCLESQENTTCNIIGDGRAGLQSIREDTFDVILLDLAMPEFSGFDIFKALKDGDLLRSNNVLIFTASSVTDNEVHEMLSSGAKGVLRKPLSIDDLISAVERFRQNGN